MCQTRDSVLKNGFFFYLFSHPPLSLWSLGRFLRGTCKKTDGKCPFSHKVSKDKVCMAS